MKRTIYSYTLEYKVFRNGKSLTIVYRYRNKESHPVEEEIFGVPISRKRAYEIIGSEKWCKRGVNYDNVILTDID